MINSGSAGEVYVFSEPNGGWASESETARLTASNAVTDALLGYSVAVDGGTIVAGAPNLGVGNASDGALYEFSEPQGGWATATETAELTALNAPSGEQLGRSVAVSGTTIVGGAPYATESGTGSAGAAYVFTEPQGGWSSGHQQAALTSSSPSVSDLVGYRVAIAGQTIAVGAPRPSPSGNGDGAVLVYNEPQGGWASATETQRLTAADGAEGDSLGVAVAISGSTVVGGAEEATVGGSAAAGAAYVFNGLPQHQLTVSVTGSGRVTGNGISCPGTCSASYASGTAVTLTAAASGAGTFEGWSGACAPATIASTCQVTLNSDLSVGASFMSATSTPPPAPPIVLTPPVVSGTPKAGTTLSCNGDTYSGLGSPSIVTATWYERERSLSRLSIYTVTQIGSGRSLVVGDLDPGVSIYCETTATASSGAAVTATSAMVTMLASIPALASPLVAINRHTSPTINSTITPGGTNTCTSGVWLHHPLRFAYVWYALPSRTSAIGPAYRVGTGSTLKITSTMQDDFIVCEVTATNEAGVGLRAQQQLSRARAGLRRARQRDRGHPGCADAGAADALRL